MRGRTAVIWLLVVALAAASVYGLVLIRHGFSARDNPSRFEAAVATSMRKLAIPAGAREQKNPFSPTPEILREAKIMFGDECALCHANDGSGKTAIGQNLYPKAPDMRLAATQELTDGELYYIIHNGIRLTGMPAWGEPGRDEDSWKLVCLIRRLPTLTPEEIAEIKRFNPKSMAGMEEQREIDEFLSGNDDSKPSQESKQPRKH